MPIDVDSAFHRKIRSNDAYIVSVTSSVASGGTFNVHLKNPSGSEKTIWIVEIDASSDGAYKATVHDGFSSAPSGGSSAEIQGILLDSDAVDDDGVTEANTDVSYTSNSQHAVGIFGGGGGGASVGGVTTHATMAMEPGREIVVEIENTSASTNEYAITIPYYEKEGKQLR